jgi:hypothetical protein
MPNDVNKIGQKPVLGAPCSNCQKPLTAASHGVNVLDHVICCVDCDRMDTWPNLLA